MSTARSTLHRGREPPGVVSCWLLVRNNLYYVDLAEGRPSMRFTPLCTHVARSYLGWRQPV